MGGYFAVSTLLFYFSCDLHQSKKVRTRRRGILGMNMNTEIIFSKKTAALIDQNRRLQLYDSG